MEGLFKFDGDMSQYKPWKSRVRDHCSEEWSYWRDVLDHAERVPYELKSEALNNMQLFGVNAAALSTDLWSFLLRWIGPTLYLRRMKIAPNIEGNGLELWRKLFTEYQGSDVLLQVVGRTKLQDFQHARASSSSTTTLTSGLTCSTSMGTTSGRLMLRQCS